jgi:hypothetical protein
MCKTDKSVPVWYLQKFQKKKQFRKISERNGALDLKKFGIWVPKKAGSGCVAQRSESFCCVSRVLDG